MDSKTPRIAAALVVLPLMFASTVTAGDTPTVRGFTDLRNIQLGLPIPDQAYCDMPYLVVTKDGNWLCTLTTGPGQEGQTGQHVVSTISTDRGSTWSPLIDIEPSGGPDASWAMPLVTPGGRVYVFYNYNGDRVDHLPDGAKKIRADMLGWFCYRYSDDHGRSWSKDRYRLPMRVTACDRQNNWQGRVQIFWGIDKPKINGSSVLFAFTKLGRYILDDGEGWLYHSDNILTERDVGKVRWELLPDGEDGIRADEFGSVQEEHNHVSLGGDSLYMVYRTTTGYPCHSYSGDRGHTWSKPEHMAYTPGGRRVKNPRACPKLWRCENGKYLFWFHNNSGPSFHGRNPAWVSGGVQKAGKMHWSEPEILLYDDDPGIRMSYPELIEQDGRYWVTETQKTMAHVHEIDKTLLEGLWSQGETKRVTRKGLLIEAMAGETALPSPIDLSKTGGVSLELWLTLDDPTIPQTLVDARDESGKGMALSTTERETIRIDLSDGQADASWDCDPGLLRSGVQHHVMAIVDAGPKIITFVVDGQLCDGGPSRQFGWGRYPKPLGDVSGSGKLRIAPSITKLRLYERYLRTSEAISNFHTGP